MKLPFYKSSSSNIDLNKPLLPEQIKNLTSKQKQQLVNKGIASSFQIKTLTGQAQLSKRRSIPTKSHETINDLKDDIKQYYSKTDSSFISKELKRLYNLI